jgi:Tfp pilus assembly protein PilE
MGQQQLLLIILGVIVVGIAVAVGITMFNDSATSSNRDALTNDLINLASRAQQYYRRPIALGGGGGTFATVLMRHLTKTSTTTAANGNGTFSMGTPTATSVILTGTGMEKGANGSAVSVEMTVWADSAKVTNSN